MTRKYLSDMIDGCRNKTRLDLIDELSGRKEVTLK